MGLTLGTIAAIAWIVWKQRTVFSHVLSIDVATLAHVGERHHLSFLVNGIEMQVLVGKFGPKIPFRETMGLGLMVSTLNYLPMKTGTLLLGVVMRARHKVRLADFAALIAGSTVMYLGRAPSPGPFACSRTTLTR